MSGVFQNIDPPPPQRPSSVYPPAFVGGGGGGLTRWVERGWGVNILEDARHCSVLFIRKYFVVCWVSANFFDASVQHSENLFKIFFMYKKELNFEK